jgi:hypothetical protein
MFFERYCVLGRDVASAASGRSVNAFADLKLCRDVCLFGFVAATVAADCSEVLEG